MSTSCTPRRGASAALGKSCLEFLRSRERSAMVNRCAVLRTLLCLAHAWVADDTVSTDAPRVYAPVLAFHLEHQLRCLGLDHVVVIAVWAVLVRTLVLRHVLAKRAAALFAHECELERLEQRVVLRLFVALRALSAATHVKKLAAARRTNRDLRI